MGINLNVITMYGVRIPWNDDLRDDLEDDYEDDYKIECVVDGMTGDWIYLGNILYDSGDFRYFENMNDFQESEVWDLGNKRVEWMNKFRKLYPQHEHLVLSERWKLLNFIYYH